MTVAKWFRSFKHHVWALYQEILYRIKPWTGLFYAPVVIYSMGKVGSTTVQATLGKLRLPNPIFHIHFLSWEYLDEVEALARRAGWGIGGHISAGKHLRVFADRTWGRVHWKVITLVREPVGREISDLFENLRTFPQFTGLSGEELTSGALAHLQTGMANFNEMEDYACNWFDRELKSVFGFDIYAAPFDPASGYAIYHTGRADILLIRLEDLSRVGIRALNEFLGLANVTLVNANQGEQKSYQDIYRQVIRQIRFPATVLEAVYATRYARHFYSAAEREKLAQHWAQNQVLNG